MKHPEKKVARSIDMPGRSINFTDMVYSGKSSDPDALEKKVFASERDFYPPPPKYQLYCGDMHGHTTISDAFDYADVDTYFRSIRDIAKLDFGALSDHDHGGVGKAELWKDGKWELIQEKVREYYQPGKFTTLLAYERDSYPYYNNLVVYYRGGNGEMLRGVHDGEITGEELRKWLRRDDLLIVPHDSYSLSAGCDFLTMPEDLFTPLLEIYSCSDCAEYFDHPLHKGSWVRGGAWQDALKRGAKMGVIGNSDDHTGTPGQDHTDEAHPYQNRNAVWTKGKGRETIFDDLNVPYPYCYRGVTGVWAAENSREAIFDALRARRCYAFMGNQRISLDFRINGHYMGEEFTLPPGEEKRIWIDMRCPEKIERVTLVKNCQDHVILYGNGTQVLFDYKQETECDCYYVRGITEEGRYCWSSPIWINLGWAGAPQPIF